MPVSKQLMPSNSTIACYKKVAAVTVTVMVIAMAIRTITVSMNGEFRGFQSIDKATFERLTGPLFTWYPGTLALSDPAIQRVYPSEERGTRQ